MGAIQYNPPDAVSNVCIYGMENRSSIQGRAKEFSLNRIHSNCRTHSPLYQKNAWVKRHKRGAISLGLLFTASIGT